jgi:thioesterase DpgC
VNLEEWFLINPVLGKTLEDDAKVLAHYAYFGQEFMAQLPVKKDRSVDESLLAQRILSRLRPLRSSFIDRHAHEVYSVLTDNFSRYCQISDLVFKAADRFPGVLPTRGQIESERECIQAHKEGFEIDQGIFLRGILREPSAGLHLADSMLLPSARALSLLSELQRCDTVDLGLILLERRGNAAYLTVNNQSQLNAESDRLIDDMETAVDLILLDNRIGVGVLRGGIMEHPRYRGKRVFSSGINLSDLHAGRISFLDFLLRREFGYISKILHGLLAESPVETRTITKPWIAAVDSFAIGGGMQLLLVFDKVIAADDAYFSLPAAQEGIVPGAANLRMLLVGGSRLTRQVILSGRKIYATDPEARNICDEVVPSSEIEARVDAAVNAFAKPAVVENRRMLALAQEPRDRFCEYMAEFAYVQAMRMNSPDVLAQIERWADGRKRMSTEEQAACS